jgi:O-antigen ligase
MKQLLPHVHPVLYVYKSMANKMQNNIRDKVLLVLLVVMLLTLFVSRALLSASMILFVLVSCAHKDFGRQLKTFGANPLLVAMSLLFFIPFLSGLWSSHTDEWLDVVRVKLPLLFFPLAFTGPWKLPQRKGQELAYIFLTVLFLSTLWSFTHYLLHREALQNAYLRAQVIRTPFENDHVHYSWLVSIGALFCLFLHERGKKRMRVLMLILAGWFMAYLHILSARMGLICLYAILILYACRLIFRLKRRSMGMAGIIILFALPVVSWFVFPTFQNRIRYFVYDINSVREQKYRGGSNDGARILSLQAGWQILKEHPWGVGAGDVFAESNHWYQQHVPGMWENDKLFPSSEWLLYGCATGWAGLFLLSVVLLYILFYKNIQHRFYWRLLHFAAIFSFVVDIGLESQYGVFLYVFLVLWLWKWWQIEAAPTAADDTPKDIVAHYQSS